MRQGRHFLQIPGPSPVPDRVLRAMDMPVIDHRSAEFAELGRAVLEGSQKIFQTSGPVVIFPSSGTGAWEAAIVNTLSPGDKVLMVETGHFATLWRQMAARWGIDVDFLPGDWRRGADPAARSKKGWRGCRACAQGGDGRSQRNLDRRHQSDRRNPRRDRPGRSSGLADGRHHLLARIGRLPARRMEGRCQRQLLAERVSCCRPVWASTRSRRRPAPPPRPTECRGRIGIGRKC